MPVSGATRVVESFDAGGVAAIGNFDGVHRGHQAMVSTLRRCADELGVPAVAVTFDPPPIEILRPDVAPPRLMTLARKTHFLKSAGADHVAVLRTDRELLGLSAEQFFTDVLVRQLRVQGLVEGPNFRFGKGREGDVTRLRSFCEQAGIALTVIDPFEVGGEMVSSSLIRRLIAGGELGKANGLLGRSLEVLGTVGRGAGRGGDLGFPTANLSNIATLLPPEGVYAGRTSLNGRSHPVAVHIGPNRTFGETAANFEAHVLDFSGDLYGSELCVELIERIRPTNRFDSAAALVSQMAADCEQARALVADFAAKE